MSAELAEVREPGMNLVTVGKNGRAYQRSFDHDEAIEMRAAGQSYGAIAKHFGVSATSIARVCDPRTRQRLDAQTRKNMEAKRRPCKGGCGQLVWLHTKGRTGYCLSCIAALKTAAGERPNELRCTKCGEWKSDDEFRAENRQTRRGRSSHCRKCENAARSDHRHRHVAATAAYDKQRKGLAMHTYTVLRQETSENGASARWIELGEFEAGSPAGAVEKAAAPDEPGVFIAATGPNIVEMTRQVVYRAVSRKSTAAR